ncbi:hypothetical protein E4U42_006809 [Claviceps africana]|uniref:Rad21/Rec8-like protein N-terminal domain-containing protein n=1 Tax=Claviceps africana TaxID=83212 RepID=A0A8K0NL08_9HYPO|nr:hypothetical protein E4U42_006809 [Claviceps africana]
MFYSHEILSNSQYGVSTIWLVATVGKGSQRRLNRKVIQGVNVPKACQKIIDPGAPLALRLQGNLLFGVSRVFAHQCNYVLSDAEKTQSDMMTFFRSMNTSETDPAAGKTKRHQIMLQDDPQFDPLAMLPRLDDIMTYEIRSNLISTQESSHKFSQLSPLDPSAVPSACTSRRSSIMGLDLPPSSLSVGSYQLPGNLCHSSPFPKAFQEAEAMQSDGLFPDYGFDLDPIHGMGLEFDADGNLVSIMDAEPQLPPLRGTSPTLAQVGRRENQHIHEGFHEESFVDLGEAALPDAEAFAVQTAAGQSRHGNVFNFATQTAEAERTSAAMHATRGRRCKTFIDREIRVPRDEFRAWTENYAANMQSAARRRAKSTTLAKAKMNAHGFMYGNGISGVGSLQQDLGVQHPLAADFAGVALKAHMLGLPVDMMKKPPQKRGRRRKSSEAFDEEEEEEEEEAGADGRDTRNVKQRIDHGDELHFGDDSAPEVGMEAAPEMEDKNSSLVLMPWSRHGSAAPGSATHAPGSAQKSMAAPSPLHGRGSIVGSIERHSDPVEEAFPDVGLGSEPSSMLFGQGPEEAGFHGPDNTTTNDTRASIAGLDMSSHDFLDYVTEQIHHHGTTRRNTRDAKRWIHFEQLASPAVHSKTVAAQAFLHILSLASKTIITVEQDGSRDKQPFGLLHIGYSTPVSRPENNATATAVAERG